MVIIISYNKQTWNEYNDSQTAHENLAKGAIISADRLNHMETGISNNDTNKVTDNKDGTIEVNGSSITPADNSKVVHSTDMRKPAYDVAGIEEVSAKQDKISYTPADDSKVVHKTGNEEIGGQKTFDIAPIDKTTGNPYITKDGVPNLPSDIARTGQANTFSSLQTFSQGAKTLQTGSYDDVNSLVNEGLYFNTNSSIKNGARSIKTGYIQVMSGYGGFVRQIIYSDTDESLMCHRISKNGGSSWSNWVQIINFDRIPWDVVETDTPQTFTAQQTFSIAPIDKTTGNPYITKDDVTKAVNTATSNFSKFIEASKNDKDSAISDSTKGNSDAIYYWTKD